MQGMEVPKNGFPLRRKAVCCGKQTKRGEIVIVIENRTGANLTGHTILHKRCILRLCEVLPVDASDYESKFKDLQKRILETGDAFPAKPKKKKGKVYVQPTVDIEPITDTS